MKVLFLTPWYPSPEDEMSGLFVQKHVEAVRSQGIEVRVIHSTGWLDTWRQWRALQSEGWMPDVVQLNVIQKQGLLALWIKHHFGTPFVVIEHWSGYLPENGQFARFSRVKKRFMKRVCREAERVMTVSIPLQKAMQNSGFEAKQWDTIDNVVDEFFKDDIPDDERPNDGIKTLLHVSCFDEQAKNITGLLRAAKMLSEKRQDWRLVLVGFGIDWKKVHDYAWTLHIPTGIVCWTGEQTPRDVADEMHRADALVLCSRYETYGVVLAEAKVVGLPILSTPVGIAEEIGALIVPQEIAQNKPGKFAEFMETILFNNERLPINDCQDRFSAESIGKKLKDIYDSCLHRNI